MARTWIFQASPNRYDIDGFLATKPGPTKWLVRRYAKGIRAGDTAYIWRAASRTNDLPSGIIARASVLDEPAVSKDDPNAAKFWKDGDDGSSEAMRVGIEIVEAASPSGVIRRTDLLQDRILRALPILAQPNGTNYPVDESLEEVLAQRWSKSPKAWSVSPKPFHGRHWRMAMRVGDGGYEMWDDCFELGIAAITYDGIGETDFSAVPEKDASAIWANLSVSQKSSIHALVYEMRGGDVVYVKQGPNIVGKGVIRGVPGQRAYAFNAASRRLVDPNGFPWLQQVRVAWANDFVPVEITVGTNQRFTIQAIDAADAERVDGTVERTAASTQDTAEAEDEAALSTESYLRASPAGLKIIARRHNSLSNAFSAWLKSQHGVLAVREREQVDVRFALGGRKVLVELKVCFGVGTRHAIREALGQLFEYNYYPRRLAGDEWLLVLDKKPEPDDRTYVETLRATLSVPLFLGWHEGDAFHFHPSWPMA